MYKKIDIKATLSLREASVFSDQGLMQNSWLPKRTRKDLVLIDPLTALSMAGKVMEKKRKNVEMEERKKESL